MGNPTFLGGKKWVWKVLILLHKQTKRRFHLTLFVCAPKLISWPGFFYWHLLPDMYCLMMFIPEIMHNACNSFSFNAHLGAPIGLIWNNCISFSMTFSLEYLSAVIAAWFFGCLEFPKLFLFWKFYAFLQGALQNKATVIQILIS